MFSLSAASSLRAHVPHHGADAFRTPEQIASDAAPHAAAPEGSRRPRREAAPEPGLPAVVHVPHRAEYDAGPCRVCRRPQLRAREHRAVVPGELHKPCHRRPGERAAPSRLPALTSTLTRAPVVLLRWQLVTDVVVSNHALRKSIEEHAQQCFNQVSAKEIVTVALLNPLLEPLRICAG